MRRATVFLSCGQREDEKPLAHEIEMMIKDDDVGLDCYNADSVQGFDDVMSITERLAESDYFLFIDFKREGPIPVSVFTHQEFALARAWGIENMLAFIEEGLDPRENGMLAYVLAHPTKFKREELVDMVKRQIKAKGWRADYSRNLVPGDEVTASGLIRYGDHTGQYMERVWQFSVHNRRNDRAAVNAVAILDSVTDLATGKVTPSYDRSYLKWTGQKDCYQRTIIPGEVASVDAFAVREIPGVFLHSAYDSPRDPVIGDVGTYSLRYRVYAEGFPMLVVTLMVEYGGPLQLHVADTPTSASVVMEDSGPEGSQV